MLKKEKEKIIQKFLNVNIINFENVDKPEGGGSDNVDKVILLKGHRPSANLS